MLPIEVRVNLKPGIAIIVELRESTERDTDHMKRLASMLVTLSRAIDQWQARHGSFGVPMPPVKTSELEEIEVGTR